MDYHYFGPPLPNGRTSPYWPADMPWNPKDAQSALGEKLGNLASVVSKGPYCGLPEDIECICTGKVCMMPIFWRIAGLMGLNKLKISQRGGLVGGARSINKWSVLVPKILSSDHGGSFITDVGPHAIAAVRYAVEKHPNIDNAIRQMWGVYDIDSLIIAITMPDSALRSEAVSEIKKYAPVVAA
jgi:hypothetical protein